LELIVRMHAMLLVACSQPHTAVAPQPLPAPSGDRASLQLDKPTLLRSGVSEKLVRQLERSRFSYFRMLAEAFELRTCEAFRDIAIALPTTAVHGDAHLEQFAVTHDSYGLADFDHGGFGPAVVDLVRYAASLHVACADAAWRCDGDAAAERFFTTYRATLIAEPAPRQPAVVQRLRERAPSSRAAWLSEIDGRIVPVEPSLDAMFRRSWVPFAKLMRDLHPEWTESAMDIVRLGWLRMGIGSAREHKGLIRLAGPTADPEDDVIVEAREGMQSKPQSCIWRGAPGQSPVLLVMSIVGRRMPELYGYAAILGRTRSYWLQSWDPQYVELAVSDVTSQSELEELASDAGRQLAGHLWSHAPELLQRYQRYAQATAFDETHPRIARLALALARESDAAWERFRGGATSR
jgi:hypothetical protein